MTEDEAKTKWCPFANALSAVALDGRIVGAAGTNRGPSKNARGLRADGVKEASLCIGPACMAWRWTYSPAQAEATRNPDAAASGYCGLAGKPE